MSDSAQDLLEELDKEAHEEWDRKLLAHLNKIMEDSTEVVLEPWVYYWLIRQGNLRGYPGTSFYVQTLKGTCKVILKHSEEARRIEGNK